MRTYSWLIGFVAASVAVGGEPDARVDRHGDPLPEFAVARFGAMRFRHSHFVYDLAYSPDGKLLASVSADGLRVWEPASGKQRFAVPHPGAPSDRFGSSGDWFSSVAFSPDSTIIAACGWEGNVHLFSAATSRSVRVWRAHADCAWLGAFSWDGGAFITSGRDGVARIWDWRTGAERMTFGKPAKNVIVRAVLSPDGKTVATTTYRVQGGAQDDISIQIWNAKTGKMLVRIPFTFDTRPQGVVFAPDSKTLAVLEKGLSFWDTTTGERALGCHVPGQGVSLVAFAPDGRTMAVGGYQGRFPDVHCFEWPSGKLVSRIATNLGGTSALAIAPDNKTLAVSYYDESCVRFFDARSGKENPSAPGPRGPVNAVAFSPDGKTLYSAADHVVRAWEVATAIERHQFRGHDQTVASLALSRDGKTLAAGNLLTYGSRATQGAKILMWDVGTGRRVNEIPDVGLAGVMSLAFAPDQKSLLAGYLDFSYPPQWRRWTATSPGKLIPCENLEDAKQACYFRDSLFVWSPHELEIWNADGAFRRRRIPLAIDAHWIRNPLATISPDGHWLALADGTNETAGQIHIFEIATGQRGRILKGPKEALQCLAFSPDGRRLLSSSLAGKNVDVWDRATGKKVASLAGHHGIVNALAFSPNGKHLATGSTDTTMLLWDVAKIPGFVIAPAKLGAMEREVCWQDLADPEAERALGAIGRLTCDVHQAPPFIARKLCDIALPLPARIRGWLSDLESSDFRVREQAKAKLLKAGKIIEPVLFQAQGEKRSLEFKRRIAAILEDLEKAPLPADLLQCQRAVQVLEAIGTMEARRTLEFLDSRGVPDAAPALERLSQRETTTK